MFPCLCVTFSHCSTKRSKITGVICVIFHRCQKEFLPFLSTVFVSFISQDPTSALLQLAENSGMSNRFHALSLGQGQAPIATRMIKEGVKDVSSIFTNRFIALLLFTKIPKVIPLGWPGLIGECRPISTGRSSIIESTLNF